MSSRERRVLSRFRCSICARRLPADRYVYSTYTGSRYCFPGEGCGRDRARPAKRRRPK